ncbi:DUF134 domain-containing protein [Methanosphaerula palustris]|uniref:DUF134 domain-containing protein n=1 Tax=Methanosphaerula palustris TaxID=475088 RepID=UPI000A076A37|nr:DUF134 domain-containing protein [Methanosphaerula palustris]
MTSMPKTIDHTARAVPRTYQQSLEQEQAVVILGISRKTVWRDIQEAHRKVTDVLMHGQHHQHHPFPEHRDRSLDTMRVLNRPYAAEPRSIFDNTQAHLRTSPLPQARTIARH